MHCLKRNERYLTFKIISIYHNMLILTILIYLVDNVLPFWSNYGHGSLKLLTFLNIITSKEKRRGASGGGKLQFRYKNENID